ncbi:MAG: hypothetical protein M1816_003026 [Peltula sp. TS41687]|nr:MAG: hypothetical protein M1816_003026 [Peltula sp. TS41687]
MAPSIPSLLLPPPRPQRANPVPPTAAQTTTAPSRPRGYPKTRGPSGTPPARGARTSRLLPFWQTFLSMNVSANASTSAKKASSAFFKRDFAVDVDTMPKLSSAEWDLRPGGFGGEVRTGVVKKDEHGEFDFATLLSLGLASAKLSFAVIGSLLFKCNRNVAVRVFSDVFGSIVFGYLHWAIMPHSSVTEAYTIMTIPGFSFEGHEQAGGS